MSRIDELITELCPDGVEYFAVAELFDLRNGYTPSKSNPLFWVDGEIPWFRMEDLRENGGVLSTAIQQIPEVAAKGGKLFPANSLLVATSATIGEHALITVPHLSNQRFTSLSPKLSFIDRLDMKFAYYYGFVLDSWCLNNTTTSSFASVDMSGFKKFRFPVPPLEIQREIVRVLDTFSKMEAELEAELDARKQQYEHYRYVLLTEVEAIGSPTELGELGRIITGRTPKASDASPWGDDVDFITPSDIKNGMKSVSNPARHLSKTGADSLSKVIIPARSLLVTCIGADMGKTVINVNKCATNQQINSITLNSGIDTDFVFHVLTSMRDKIRAQGERAGGTMPIINKSDFSKIKIFLPPLPEQKRIAAILDSLDALVNDLYIGLPAELAARRQQHKYYRDKLLSFREEV